MLVLERPGKPWGELSRGEEKKKKKRGRCLRVSDGALHRGDLWGDRSQNALRAERSGVTEACGEDGTDTGRCADAARRQRERDTAVGRGRASTGHTEALLKSLGQLRSQWRHHGCVGAELGRQRGRKALGPGGETFFKSCPAPLISLAFNGFVCFTCEWALPTPFSSDSTYKLCSGSSVLSKRHYINWLSVLNNEFVVLNMLHPHRLIQLIQYMPRIYFFLL